MARHISALVAAAGGLAALAPSSLAQTAENNGSVVTAFFESSLEANDNLNLRSDSLGNTLIWTNTAGAGMVLLDETDLFAMNVRGSYRFADLPAGENLNKFDDPRLNLRFNRNIGDDFLNFSASFRRVDQDFFNPLSDVDPDGSFDNSTDGTRESADVRLGASINNDGPIGFDLDGYYLVRKYTDTSDPDNNDRTIAGISGELAFRLNPILNATLGAEYDQRTYVKPSLEDRYRTTVDVGLNGYINQRATAFFRLGYSEVDKSNDDTSEQENGVVGSIGTNIDTRTGAVRAIASSELTENGIRNTVTVGQLLELPLSTLDYEIGATNSEDTPIRGTGAITYTRQGQRSALEARLRQNAAVNDEGQNILNTLAGIGYRQDINRVSSFSVNLDAGLTRYEDGNRSDTERANFTASYNHALTRDWGFNAGYTHRWRSEDAEDDAQSNAVFFNLRRDWQALR